VDVRVSQILATARAEELDAPLGIRTRRTPIANGVLGWAKGMAERVGFELFRLLQIL